MGCIVLREVLTDESPQRLGEVLLIAPPNHGTPLAKPLKWRPLQKLVGLPAAGLVPGPQGRPRQLPDSMDCGPGIMMGTRSGWFPMLSWFIPGPDDGVVPVAGGKIDGMRDFITVPVSHTSLPHHRVSLAQTLHFLQTGRFLSNSIPAMMQKPIRG